MIDEIYSQKILGLAANISRIGQVADADASAERTSRLCGSSIKVFVKVIDGHVVDFAQEVRACALGQASCSIMAANVIGASVEELRTSKFAMQQMLSGEGEGPLGRFEDARLLAPVKDYKSRHGSVMLAFDATLAAVEEAVALPTMSVEL